MQERRTNTGAIVVGGLILAAVGGLLWWKSGQAAPEGKAKLIGVVSDADSNVPIGGVTVALDGNEVTTNSGGQYQFIVDPGAYFITFDKAGYQGGAMSILLQEGDNILNVQMVLITTPEATLVGQVTDVSTGQPINQVKVTLDSLVGYTDASGQYSFEGLEPGTYDMMLEKSGYQTVVL